MVNYSSVAFQIPQEIIFVSVFDLFVTYCLFAFISDCYFFCNIGSY